MIPVLFAAAGFVATTLVWRAMAGLFAAPVLERENFRGRRLPVATGIAVIAAVLAVAAVALVVVAAGDLDDPEWRTSLAAAGVLSVGLGLLGLIDDLVGTTARRGFRGHLGGLLRGEVTTGALKLAGTPAVALVALAAVGPLGRDSLRHVLVISAAANLANLFDRAPGRVIKVTTLSGLALAPWCAAALLAGPAVVLGAGLGMAPADLGERGMLGDTGANVLGGAVGLLVVGGYGATGQWTALAVLVALNLASEFVSFSKVIASTPPLRWLDQLGRD